MSATRGFLAALECTKFFFGSAPDAAGGAYRAGGRLPILSARPAVTPATLKRAATNFAAW